MSHPAEMEMYGLQAPDNYFHIDDLLDFSNDDLFSTTTTTTHDSDTAHHHLPPPTTTNPTSTTNNNISTTTTHNNFINNNNHNQNRIPNFSDDLCVPNDDVAELEWLSKFVDDSFSDFSMNDITGTTNFNYRQQQQPSSSVLPGTKASRSKRSRSIASTHKSWISLPPESASNNIHHHHIIPSSVVISAGTTKSKQRSVIISSLSSPSSSSVSAAGGGRVIGNGDHHHHHQSSSTSSSSSSGEGGGGSRKCTHCASEKTPQWRTGPMGPKTLCNACGVRYKSGRLVPEYRPAASPTFVLTQHSNSHRKVMELRRQKEILTGSHHQHQHQHQHQRQDHNSSNNNNNNTHEFFHHPHHDFEVC